MPLHATAKKRIAILIIVLLLIAVGIVGWSALRESQKRGQAINHRSAGLEAFEAGKFIQASHHLHEFLRYQNDDVEAHQRYAEAQMRVPRLDMNNVAQALRSLTRARELEPDNMSVNEQLLGLYELLEKNEDSLSLAEYMLRHDPDNLPAKRAQAIALSRLHRHAEALEVTKQIVESDPKDTDMQLLYLDMENKTLAPGEDLIRYAGRMKDEHPDDPRFDLVRAYAHYLVGDREMMTELMRRAADTAPPDAGYVNTLIRFADAVGLYPLSLRALIRADENLDDPLLERELTFRLMELGRYNQVAERLADVDANADPLDLEGVTMRVIALMRTDQRNVADEIVVELEALEKNPHAMERGDMLETLFRPGGVSTDELVVTAETDLKMSPNSPWIRGILGDGYYAQNEPEQAIEQWEYAARLRPSWANPLIRQVQPLVAMGKTQEAVDRARGALVRAPTNIDAYRALALSRAANLSNNPADSADAILKVIDEVDRLAPGDEGMLRLRLSLLEDVGRVDEAQETLTAALNSDDDLSEETLIDLANRARRLGLNVDEQAFARSVSLHGNTAELAFARAVALADRGLGDDGLRLYEQAMRDHADDFEWRLNHARYLDQIDSPRAAEAWTLLASEHPDDDRLQRLALRSPAMRVNREYTDQIIQRLETIGGTHGVTWRVERARWLLEGDPPREQANEAVKLLREAIEHAPDRIEAKVLLARALEQTGKLQLAARELEQVALARPDSPAVALELARINQALRQYPAALEQLRRVAENPAATPVMLRQAATLLAEQGQDQRALAAMLKQQETGVAPAPQDLLLMAELYTRTGQDRRVETLIPQIEREPTPETLAWLAGWYAGRDQPEQAAAALDRLDDLDIEPIQRAAIRADYLARHGDPGKALEYDIAAVEAAPDDPRPRLRLVARQILLGRGTDAVATARAALDRGIDDPTLRRVVDNADIIERFAGETGYRALVLSLLASNTNAEAAGQALRLLDQEQGNLSPALLRRLSTLADSSRDLLPLRTLVAKLYLETGQHLEAAEIATQTAADFPTAVEPAWLATEALLASDQPDRALIFARQWREQAPDQARQADMQIAAAELELGDYDAALTVLNPYLSESLADPNELGNAELISRFARGLVMAQRMGDAQRMLLPLSADSPQWRRVSTHLATFGASSGREAVAWLDAIEKQTPESEIDNRIALAQAWWAVGAKSNNLNAGPRARAIVETVTAQPDAPAGAWFLQGLIAESEGDLAAAAEGYRTAIKGNPNLNAAKNNLAMVLAQDGATATEAVRLAREAVEASPDNANYLDTLAFAASKAGDTDLAVSSLKQAIDLDPLNPKWKLNLIEVLRDADRADEAETLRLQLQAAGVNVPG